MPKASSTSASPTSAGPTSVSVPLDEAVAPSYEAAMVELETLVGRLDSGDMPLEHMLSAYQRGAQLLQFCREKLQAVEDQIKVLDDGALKVWKA